MVARGSSLAATLRDLAIIPSVPCAFEVLSPESNLHTSDAVIALNLKTLEACSLDVRRICLVGRIFSQITAHACKEKHLQFPKNLTPPHPQQSHFLSWQLQIWGANSSD